MANFSYEQYTAAVAAAQANQNGEGGNAVKIGYFKLAQDGDIAVARINVASTDELMFASVHQLNNVTLNGNRWPKVSCLNPLGMGGACPLCEMSKEPNSNVGKAAKKVYIPMVVSYRDPQSPTGYTAPAPVIWERPASFARELANKLVVAGDLRNTLVLITRNGQKGDMQTTYSMDILPEAHPVFKPELIPMDFSAFANFNIAKHSYWEKTFEEIQTFAQTGSFPEAVRTPGQAIPNAAPTATPQYNAPYGAPNTPLVAPATPTVETVAPSTFEITHNNWYSPATETQPEIPVRNFTGCSF